MMKTILEEYEERYPDLFNDSLISFDCGDGWRPLLDKACNKLTGTGAIVIQVKEKFGGLRFYADCDEEGHKFIYEIEKLSFKVCEECSTEEDVETKGGWLKTLCSKCREERFKKR